MAITRIVLMLSCLTPFGVVMAFTPLPKAPATTATTRNDVALAATTDDSVLSLAEDSFNLVVVGDLHMEDDMSKHEQARQDCVDALKDLSLLLPSSSSSSQQSSASIQSILQDLQQRPAGELSQDELRLLLRCKTVSDPSLLNCFLGSLGDLGRKDIRHEPGDAGTTLSFQMAKDYFDGFGLPYNLVTGNHDLEGLDEFDTDHDNLQAWMDCFHLDTPHFQRYIGSKTLLLGVSTVRFRDAPFSSHEVHIDDAQLQWFQETVQNHPASEGWKIVILSHAPIMGSGLRALQNVHITNGCAWLNHCSPQSRGLFLDTVRSNPQIKLWCSGHFHLSHDYQDAISTIGSCTFVQVGVMGPVSTRDGRRQTRIVQGNRNVWKIYTVNHHERVMMEKDNMKSSRQDKAKLRLDATIDIQEGTVQLESAGIDVNGRDDWFQAYLPSEQDGCYLENPAGTVASDAQQMQTKVCWWHMADGAVLGLHGGMLVEYDAQTLSPLGIVVNQSTLRDRQVMVVEDGSAVVLVAPDGSDMEVVHPNEDGSYWRKVQRNKRVRLEEKAREAAAREWLERQRQQEQQQ